jgi:hypothetical protein
MQVAFRMKNAAFRVLDYEAGYAEESTRRGNL